MNGPQALPVPSPTTDAGSLEHDVSASIAAVRAVGEEWAATPLARRLDVVRRLRGLIARSADALLAAVDARSSDLRAEALSAQIVPLADAARFLTGRAPALLAPRRLGRRGRPVWLGRVDTTIHREPLGVVLVIGARNYPILLPGVQILQAVTAGNAVVVKPGAGATAPVALLVRLLEEAGLPRGLVHVLPEYIDAGRIAIASGVDHVIFTGSSSAGQSVLEWAGRHGVGATAELSGCDALFVLPDADHDLVARAVAFGLRLHDGATCIAPRRIIVVDRGQADAIATRIAREIGALPRVAADSAEIDRARGCIARAIAGGARVATGSDGSPTFPPTLLTDVDPSMDVAREPSFVPLAVILAASDVEEALRLDARCPYALGATIFGPSEEAERLASRVRAGVVCVNDIIVPSADPRVPFGGAGASGFGRTRGAEGLLELTRTKAVATRRGHRRPHLDPRTDADEGLFLSYLRAAHGASLLGRSRALLGVVRGVAAVSRKVRRGP